MPSLLAPKSARTTHRVHASEISKVICHRLNDGQEQYLVSWKTKSAPVDSTAGHPYAICSWHGLEELQAALHHVQTYLETRDRSLLTAKANANAIAIANGHASANPALSCRKRKSPGSEPSTSRDSSRDFTPVALSREQSVISIGSSSSGNEWFAQKSKVYNGVLIRREGKIMAKQSQEVEKVDVARLPSAEMLQAAATAPTTTAERMIQDAFTQKLKLVKRTRWENRINGTAPSLDFTFIKDFVYGEGVDGEYVDKHGLETTVGCSKCKPNMGQNIGCEYPKLCECLEFAAVNEQSLQREDPERYSKYLQQKTGGDHIDTSGLPKRFPYQRPDARNPGRLQTFYLEERYPIYECNQKCKCGPNCKSRVVQKGRKVPLTIFKTPDRGWGVYCDEDLSRGEFIDTYIGEVLSNEEGSRRDDGKAKVSYLYDLDKFVGDDPTITEDTCYIVDGQYMGGPTRFMNHSCEPNCRQYTVSYNKNNLWIYDLAFFAFENITAGTELTFDYLDKDEEEEEEIVEEREKAARDPNNKDKKPCNCGTKKCRGFLWT